MPKFNFCYWVNNVVHTKSLSCTHTHTFPELLWEQVTTGNKSHKTTAAAKCSFLLENWLRRLGDSLTSSRVTSATEILSICPSSARNKKRSECQQPLLVSSVLRSITDQRAWTGSTREGKECVLIRHKPPRFLAAWMHSSWFRDKYDRNIKTRLTQQRPDSLKCPGFITSSHSEGF